MNDITEIKRLTLDMVEHSAGCSDHQIDPAGKGAELSLDRLAAEDSANSDITTEGQLLELADDLLSQLAGRRQDDALGPAPSGFQHLDQGNSECRRLARARLGLADDVESIERFGNEGRLNGGGRKVAGLLEGLEHDRAQTHG